MQIVRFLKSWLSSMQVNGTILRIRMRCYLAILSTHHLLYTGCFSRAGYFRVFRSFSKKGENIQSRKFISAKIYFREKERTDQEYLKKRSKIRFLFVFNVFGCVLESKSLELADWLKCALLSNECLLCPAINCK